MGTRRALEASPRNTKRNPKKTLNNTVRRCEWANRENQTRRGQTRKYSAHIGNKKSQKRKWWWGGIRQIRYQENMIPMNTWKQAALTKEEKQQIETSHDP